MSTPANQSEVEELMQALPQLSDPVWRLHNLYKIVDKLGREVPFRPTREQSQIIEAVYHKGQKRHVILKARQMGFSTLIELMILDATYFGENVQASIVDRTQPDAEAKLKTKIRFAYEKLGPLKERATVNNDSEISFANGSTINAGKSARGGTNQWLHISEWGPIAHEDPKRSAEIKTGALPSAEQGIIIVETTFKGGKGGHLYELMKTAMETPVELRTSKDFVFWFFPWYLDPTYTIEGDPRGVPAEVNKYLNDKERELGFKFTPGQRLWYAKTKAEQGIFMFREYPTTEDEAFQAPVEGAIYGNHISKLRALGQIRDFIWDRSFPVFGALDIGWDDSTSVWLFQVIGREVHWPWNVRVRQETAAQVMKRINDTEIPVSGFFLPWDARSTAAATGVNYRDEFIKAGAKNVDVLDPTRDEWATINATRDILMRSLIHRTNCKDGLESLEAYHTKDTSSGGTISKLPVHDWSSHDSKAFQYAVEAIVLGKVKTKAARIINDVKPQLPPGTIVDLDTILEERRVQRVQTAHSGFRL